MRFATGLAGVLWCLGCAGATSPVTEPASIAEGTQTYHYRVRADSTLSRLDVTLCTSGGAPERLVAGQRSAAAHLLRVESRGDDGSRKPLVRRGNTVPIPERDGRDCVGYLVDLDAASADGRWSGRVGDATMLATSSWLWRPSPRAPGTSGTVRFELPPAVQVSVPWPRVEGGGYRIDESVFRLLGRTVLGRFERSRLTVDGAELEVARLPGSLAVSKDDLEDFVRTVAGALTTLHGRFPVEKAQLVIVPVGPGPDPVAFGHVGRGGGGSVMLLVRSDATREALERHWVPIHELSHLAVPYVRREDAWFGEGVATYYQEVLRARAQLQTPLEAWRNLDDGYRRGRADGTGRTLREESRDMHETAAYRRVYWAGAAFALAADVALRRRGGNIASLDAAVAHLDRWNHAPRPWRASTLLERIDQALGEPLLVPLAASYLDSADFPDVAALYADLGLHRRTDDGLVLVDDAPDAALRRDIMRATSSNRD